MQMNKCELQTLQFTEDHSEVQCIWIKDDIWSWKLNRVISVESNPHFDWTDKCKGKYNNLLANLHSHDMLIQAGEEARSNPDLRVEWVGDPN